MKRLNFSLLAAGLLLTGAASAQTAPTSGTISYETMRRTDLSQVRVNVNGQEVRPGGTLPNGRTLDVPETMEGVENYRFAGQWAMREPMDRRNRFGMMRGGGPGGPGGGGPGGNNGPGGDGNTPPSPDQMRRMEQRMNTWRMPIEETTHTDLTTGKTAMITAVRVDSTRKDYYATTEAATRPADWEVSNKTKKFLGYTCQRVNCTIKGQPAMVWYTTELPYTFSPVASLTPDKGVVLMIESDDLMYRATKISAGPVDEASLKPSTTAKTVTREELNDIRRKAMASFRQQNGGGGMRTDRN